MSKDSERAEKDDDQLMDLIVEYTKKMNSELNQVELLSPTLGMVFLSIIIYIIIYWAGISEYIGSLFNNNVSAPFFPLLPLVIGMAGLFFLKNMINSTTWQIETYSSILHKLIERSSQLEDHGSSIMPLTAEIRRTEAEVTLKRAYTRQSFMTSFRNFVSRLGDRD